MEEKQAGRKRERERERERERGRREGKIIIKKVVTVWTGMHVGGSGKAE